MGTKYIDKSATNYNATPPVDDGTVSEANKVKWSTIKTKLADPVKTQADAISDALVTHFDNGPTALTTNTTLDATHYGKIIQVSGSSVTLTLTDAATLGAGWYCRIVNTDAANTIAIARATGGDTINATAANITLGLSATIDVFVIAAGNGFRAIQFVTQGAGSLGVIPLPRLLRVAEVTNTASSLTISSSPSTLTTIDCGTVVSADRVLVFLSVAGQKGVTSGDVTIGIEKDSGTGTIAILSWVFFVTGAGGGSGVFSQSLMAWVKVTGSGTLVLKVTGSSAGSDLTSGSATMVGSVFVGA